MPNHDVRAIANEFLMRGRQENRALTHMQLQKLPYIAHGWALPLLGVPLIQNNPEAWRYGPVYRDLYEILSRYGAGAVTDFIRENDDNPFIDDAGNIIRADLTSDEERLIDMVWDKYKEKSGIDLSAITHERGTPWRNTWETSGQGATIPNNLIKNHYEELLERNRARSRNR